MLDIFTLILTKHSYYHVSCSLYVRSAFAILWKKFRNYHPDCCTSFSVIQEFLHSYESQGFFTIIEMQNRETETANMIYCE